MFIEKKVTNKIAFLARFGLTEKEEEQFSRDLSNILKWMEELKKVDVKNIEPLRNVNETQLIERDDAKSFKNISQDELLSNAPKKNGKFFTVPKVLE